MCLCLYQVKNFQATLKHSQRTKVGHADVHGDLHGCMRKLMPTADMHMPMAQCHYPLSTVAAACKHLTYCVLMNAAHAKE